MIQGEIDAGAAVEAPVELYGVHDGLVKAAKEVVVGRRRLAPEFVQRTLEGQAVQAVDGAAEGDGRAAVFQGDDARGAVDGDRTRRMFQQCIEVARLEIDDPPLQPVTALEPGDQAGVVDQSHVQRVILDAKPAVARRPSGEGGHDVLNDLGHAGEVGVIANLGVAVELQGQHEVGPWLVDEGRDAPGVPGLPEAQLGEALEIAGVLDRRRDRRMVAIAGKEDGVAESRQVIKHIMGGAHAKRRAEPRRPRERRQAWCDLAKPGGILGQQRMAVHPLLLEGDPEGAEIALLEHMATHAIGACRGDGGPVYGALVAKEHLVGHSVALAYLLEKRRQRRQRLTESIGASALPGPVGDVAPAKCTLATRWPSATSRRARRWKKGEQTPCRNRKERLGELKSVPADEDVAVPAIETMLPAELPAATASLFQ